MTRQRKGRFRATDSNGCTLMSSPYQIITGNKLKQRGCCDAHDEHYWYGGSHEQRLHVDKELRDCVINLGSRRVGKVCFWLCGWIMFLAVRVGGTPKLPFPWRWRNNVRFDVEDVKSGYLAGGIELDVEREIDRRWIFADADNPGPDYKHKRRNKPHG